VAEVVARRPAKPSKLRLLLRDPIGLLGMVFVAGMGLAALLAPWIAPHDPSRIHGRMRLQGPGATFPLGTDEFGRDLLSRALHGAQVSLQVSLLAVGIAAVIGVAIGLAAGYFRGWFDAVAMRLMDVLFAVPTILLALAIVATLGTTIENLILALVIVYTPAFARIARRAALSVSQELYVEAAPSVGVGHWRILAFHVLPNIAAPVAVQVTISLAYAILMEAALAYLGLGVHPPDASWGSMLASGNVLVERSIWPSLAPGRGRARSATPSTAAAGSAATPGSSTSSTCRHPASATTRPAKPIAPVPCQTAAPGARIRSGSVIVRAPSARPGHPRRWRRQARQTAG
jgi:peptide/nickel transport system permease protein